MARKRPSANIWLDGYRTLALIRDRGAQLRAMCGRCRQCWDLDVAEMIERCGGDFSLADRRGKCRTPGCKGSCSFQVSPGPSTPFRPLTTRR